MKNNSIFHVHTFRCKHAGDETDKLYVEKAIELGAKEIVFTEHCPFPGNPFGNRMEIEYLPKFREYYKELYMSERLDVMMLG